MKRILSVILVCALLLLPARAAEAGGGSPAVYVDGELLELGGLPYLSQGAAYVPLRETAMALGAEAVDWRGGRAYFTSEGLSGSVAPGSLYFEANGRCLYAAGGCPMIAGRLMVPVRPLCLAFGAAVEWKNEERAVYIVTGGEPVEGGEAFYNEDDLYWLSRIIHAEASGEELAGKIAVGNVVLNRVASPLFPDSVHDVIFDRKYGVQFTPARSGTLKKDPSEESVIAAKLALEGADTAAGSLYFAASAAAASCWAGRNRPYMTQIGNHVFYG